MMDIRGLLAGAAVLTLAGSPAVAQAPRSLFEAAPAPAGSAPVTTGLDRPTPKSAAAKPAKPEDVAASAKPISAKPAAAGAAAAQPAAGSTKAAAAPPPGAPGKAGAEAAPIRRDARRRLAARVEPSPMPVPAAPAGPAAPPPGLAAAPAAAVQKPMSRAERRRALREARRQAAEPAQPAPVAPPTFATSPFQVLFGAQPAQQRGEALPAVAGRSQIDALVAHHARLNNVPEALVHRIIVRESKYNPRAVGRGGAMGLMQIKTATARGVGYAGGPAGLLDAETNLTYGIKYLAGAWRVAGGSYDRAVSHYARGYYYAAKRMGLGGSRGRRGRQPEPDTTASVAPQPPSLFSIFAQQAAAR